MPSLLVEPSSVGRRCWSRSVVASRPSLPLPLLVEPSSRRCRPLLVEPSLPSLLVEPSPLPVSLLLYQ
jgi:hypothetical protein